jgi:hypothetical protein
MVIYMGFALSTTSLFNNVNTGEAPQLPCGSTPTSSCSLYGRYDDGADVFNFYNNFAGNTLKNFLEDGASSTITINNGISFNFGSSSIVGVYLPTSYNYTKNSIFSYYLTGFSVIGTNYWVGGGISSSSSLGGTAYIRDEGLGEDWGNGIPTFGAGVQYGNTLINTYPTSTTVGDVIGLNSIYDINMTYLKTTNPTGTALWELPGGAREKLLAPFYWELGGWNSASGDVLNISYTYIRTYPPEGVMPSVSFGSIS